MMAASVCLLLLVYAVTAQMTAQHSLQHQTWQSQYNTMRGKAYLHQRCPSWKPLGTFSPFNLLQHVCEVVQGTPVSRAAAEEVPQEDIIKLEPL